MLTLTSLYGKIELPSESYRGDFLLAITQQFKTPLSCGFASRLSLGNDGNTEGAFAMSKKDKWQSRVYRPGQTKEEYEYWIRIKDFVIRRDNFRCQSCKRRLSRNALSAHHIIPRSLGGQDDNDNLITLCDTCHNTIELECVYSRYEIVDRLNPKKNPKQKEIKAERPEEEWRPAWHKFVYGGCKKS
jgi:5-methylcytosine-specific restriction endonuclease McrA